MLAIHDDHLDALAGSFTPKHRAVGWRGGVRTWPEDLPVTQWSVTVDGSALIERSGSARVVSSDEGLDPDSVSHALAVYGSEVELLTGVDLPSDPPLVPLGQFVITDSDPQDWRRVYRVTTPLATYERPHFDGVVVDLSLKDRGVKLDEWSLSRGEQSPAGATVFGEVARLVSPVGMTGTHQVPNKTLGATITFETESRLTALDQLAKHANARCIVDAHGLVTLVPRSDGAGHWDLPGESVISLRRKMSRSDFRNGVFSSGRDPETQQEYLGWAREGHEVGDPASPLAWGPVAGQSTYRHDSPLITTPAFAFADAATTFRSAVQKRMQTIEITSPLNPSLEPFDTVGFTITGKGSFTGTVQKWTGSHEGTMTITALVPLDVWMELR